MGIAFGRWQGAALALAVAPAAAWTADGTKQDGGKAVYVNQCQGCHGANLGGGFGPPLNSKDFVTRWQPQDIDKLAFYVRETMPPSQPGSLSPKQAQTVSAFILNSGAASAAMAGNSNPVPPTPGPGYHDGTADNAALTRNDAQSEAEQARRMRVAAAVTPVSEAMLRAPSDSDWIAWRRTRDAQAHSPLAQINTKTVDRLGVAWSLSLGQGTNGTAPLVHDGVMYLVNNHVVQAIDAVTGDVLWACARPAETSRLPLSQPRGMALYGTALYVPTIDSHMLAFDVRTGTMLWDSEIKQGTDILQMTGPPVVAGGNVIQGVTGCGLADVPGGCFIVALEAATGKEVWRFHTIARPGEHGGDSWNGAPLERRFGGSIWSGGSYDPDLDLVYFGTGQTYVASTLLNGTNVGPGGRDALHTNSTLALDPVTGKLVWSYQHFPGDVWDLDWGFEQVIVEMKAAPSGKAIVTVGKLGIMDAIDAKSGHYLWSQDLGVQTLITAIDPRTGRKTYDPSLVPELDKTKLVCPSSLGGRNWPATAYDPARSLLFVPMVEACMTLSLTEPGASEYRMKVVPPPKGDGNFGQFAAIDLASRKVSWRTRRRAPEMASALSTGGGIVFEGSRDRYFRAVDATTSAVLWEVRLDNVPNAFPISYAVDGRQYIAVIAGGGSPYEVGVRNLTPEFGDSHSGNKTMWVFALPENRGAKSNK